MTKVANVSLDAAFTGSILRHGPKQAFVSLKWSSKVGAEYR